MRFGEVFTLISSFFQNLSCCHLSLSTRSESVSLITVAELGTSGSSDVIIKGTTFLQPGSLD